MKKILVVLGVVIGLLLVLALPMIGSYNGLVNEDETVNNAYSQVQNVVQRRADLIPNLVETVKGYAKFEQDTLTAVIEARSQVQSAGSPDELAEANDKVTSSLGRLMVVVESYPELKADKQFINLQDELAGTENRISVERKNYNDAVGSYNKNVRRFPKSLIAGMFGFDQREYFKADEGSDKAPEVNFGG